MKAKIQIAPSILSADFSCLDKALSLLRKQKISWVHLDVMDGIFVPNISFGPPVIKSLRMRSSLFFDVHLMISEPIRYLKDFALAGADLITVHLEASQNVKKTLREIKKLERKVGLALNPKTPLKESFPYLSEIDLLLVMTVEPGFGGQKFKKSVLPKIKKASEKIKQTKAKIKLEVDGGINKETLPLVIAAGGEILVVGSAIFSQLSPAQEIKKIKEIIGQGEEIGIS